VFNEYEIVIIIRPELDEAETMAAFERVAASVTELGGHVLLKEDWGQRKFAYPIKKLQRGRYLMLVVVSAPGNMVEIERRMRLDDRVLRFLTVKLEQVTDLDARLAAAEEARKNQPEIRRRIEVEEEDEPEEDYEMADLSALD
jgi:small subunit ribosomal protein S6